MKLPFFSKQFLQSLPSDDAEAIVALGGEFQRFHEEATGKDGARAAANQLKNYPDYAEAFTVLVAFNEVREAGWSLGNFGADQRRNISHVVSKFDEVVGPAARELAHRDDTARFAGNVSTYKAIFEGTSFYKFDDQDFDTIQELINELRKQISESKLLTVDHRRRLLARLEAMQRELHRETSDIDRFWGFIGEIGIVARKFGEDIAPLVNNAQKLATIVFAVIKMKEGIHVLPDFNHMLPHREIKRIEGGTTPATQET